MKKEYSKPMAFVEDFSLQTSIAAGCELKTTLSTKDSSCGYPIRGGIVFVSGTQCTTEGYSTESLYNGFCYHVPNENSNLFNS